MRAEIFSHEKLIGTTELSLGDEAWVVYMEVSRLPKTTINTDKVGWED